MATKAPTKKQAVEKPAKRKGPGKPPKNDPDDVTAIQQKLDDYFKARTSTDDEGNEYLYKAPTFSGVALALGYSSRTSLWTWANSNSPISEPIKKALLKIDEYNEEASHGQYCTGPIFALKCRGMDVGAMAPPSDGEGRLTIDFTE